MTVFQDLQLAHKYLDGLKGIEIGASAHNPFNIEGCLNVDYTDDMETEFKKEEIRMCGKAAPVDIVASGDKLPFADNELDYVISSHCLEHFFDTIGTLEEWLRVVKPGGYVLTIVPHFARHAEKRPVTTITELIGRHEGKVKREDVSWEGAFGQKDEHGHWTVFDLQLIQDLCMARGYKLIEHEDPDKKVGNGITFLIQK